MLRLILLTHTLFDRFEYLLRREVEDLQKSILEPQLWPIREVDVVCLFYMIYAKHVLILRAPSGPRLQKKPTDRPTDCPTVRGRTSIFAQEFVIMLLFNYVMK